MESFVLHILVTAMAVEAIGNNTIRSFQNKIMYVSHIPLADMSTYIQFTFKQVCLSCLLECDSHLYLP